MYCSHLLSGDIKLPNTSLDPENWEGLRASAHDMLDAALDKMQAATEGPVWNPFPDNLKQSLKVDLPREGIGVARTQQAVQSLLPYGLGNTHPRFFGWVHGAGTPGGVVADIAAAAMNANLGGRDHGAIYVENQVIDWVRALFEFPAGSSGLVVSGTSMATVVALKVARDVKLAFANQQAGQGVVELVGYTSVQTHNCVARAFDLLGLGTDALRLIGVGENFEMDIPALKAAIAADKSAGKTPFCIVGTAGSVNVGAIDDLDAIADIAGVEDIWFHIDGAFGASLMLSEEMRPRLNGITRADSLAFDFHKWWHVNYAVGFVLIRNGADHLRSFMMQAEYLAGQKRGLAAGGPWPTDYGPELSRGFRALKVWSVLMEHGADKLGASINHNCELAQKLGRKVAVEPQLELCAPVALNIVCFSYKSARVDINDEIVMELQTRGIAAPSSTIINGQTVIRLCIANHRTTQADIDVTLAEILRLGYELSN